MSSDWFNVQYVQANVRIHVNEILPYFDQLVIPYEKKKKKKNVAGTSRSGISCLLHPRRPSTLSLPTSGSSRFAFLLSVCLSPFLIIYLSFLPFSIFTNKMHSICIVNF